MTARRIRVTQDIIDNAIRGNSRHCMVADAIRAAGIKATRVTVDVNLLRFTERVGDETIRWGYITPVRVQNYIVAFDAGDTIEPFAFDLKSDMRVPLSRQIHTTTGGGAQHTAKVTRSNARNNLAKVEADPESTPAQVEVAREKVAAAERRVAETTARLAETGEQVRRTQRPVVAEGEAQVLRPRRPPRRTYQTDREFGRRVMRENQEGWTAPTP